MTYFVRGATMLSSQIATIAGSWRAIYRLTEAIPAGASMHANITTWFISDVARKSDNVQDFLRNWQPNSYRQFFRMAAPQVVPVLQTHGMVQSFAIRTRVDMVTIVSIFRDEAGAEAAWSEISGALHEVMDGTLEFVEFSSGPAEDLIQLGCGVR